MLVGLIYPRIDSARILQPDVPKVEHSPERNRRLGALDQEHGHQVIFSWLDVHRRGAPSCPCICSHSIAQLPQRLRSHTALVRLCRFVGALPAQVKDVTFYVCSWNCRGKSPRFLILFVVLAEVIDFGNLLSVVSYIASPILKQQKTNVPAQCPRPPVSCHFLKAGRNIDQRAVHLVWIHDNKRKVFRILPQALCAQIVPITPPCLLPRRQLDFQPIVH
mmetsp:Transcript_96171/g.170712  ORF Transcript_96171/g.170712 Transcript_96171/m.170712 type:complete len:219 (-) Transcript_96171:1592-2248(-)